jgi:hypothetical protein
MIYLSSGFDFQENWFALTLPSYFFLFKFLSRVKLFLGKVTPDVPVVLAEGDMNKHTALVE